MMKWLIVLFITLQAAHALELEPIHFLYPRDAEVMWLAGIEDPVTQTDIRNSVKNCRVIKQFDTCAWLNGFQSMKASVLDQTTFSQSAQLTLIGERHIDLANQMNMAGIILRDQFDTLALEMFNHTDQAYIDQYLNDQISLEELRAVLEKGWNYESSGYVEMIRAAKSKKMKILALDDRERFADLPFSENLHQRDLNMAMVLSAHLVEFPQDKILIYTGKMHSFHAVSKNTKMKSMIELLNEMRPDLNTQSFFLYAPREKNLMTNSAKFYMNFAESTVLTGEVLAPYIQGAIFLR